MLSQLASYTLLQCAPITASVEKLERLKLLIDNGSCFFSWWYLIIFWIQYLACASRLVVADLVHEVIFENISNAELLPILMDTGQRICDVDSHCPFIYSLHSNFNSTDVTWEEDKSAVMIRLLSDVFRLVESDMFINLKEVSESYWQCVCLYVHIWSHNFFFF